MITGLKVTIKGEELRSLAASRAQFHRERAGVYKRQAESMKADRIEQDEDAGKYSNQDPMVGLQDKATSHTNQAQELEFVSEHIDLSEDYLLDWPDLQKLGIVAARW